MKNPLKTYRIVKMVDVPDDVKKTALELLLEKRGEAIVTSFLERVEDQSSRVLMVLDQESKAEVERKKRLEEVTKVLKKAKVSKKLRTTIINNPQLFKYVSQIVTKNERIIQSRREAGLDTLEKVVKHLLFRDSKGSGCGCELCKLRFDEHVYKLRLDSYRKEVNNMDIIEEDLLGITNGQSRYPLRIDPFASQFFNNHNTVYIKEAADIKERMLKRLSNAEGMLVLGERVTKSKTHLHKLIKEYFGKHLNYSQARMKIAEKVWLPL